MQSSFTFRDEIKISMKESRNYTLKGLDGKEVEVSKEVYRVVKRDEDTEVQQRYRSWCCRDGKGVRCKMKCKKAFTYL